MDNTFKPLSTLGVCYGYGGLDNGLERGIRSLRGISQGEERIEDRILKYAAHVEIESIAAYNLVAKMEQGVLAPAPVFSDLKKFPWEQFHGKVHIITGGYPCQPFSQAGLQGGVDDPRHLFPYIEFGIDAVRPVCCWFENVANHLNIGFEEVRYRLSRLGYKTEAGIFSAEQVGAPHLRKRLFILAVADTYCTEQSKRRGDFAEVLGLQEGKRQPEHSSSVPSGDGKTLDDSISRGNPEKDTISTGRDSLTGTGSAMDNSFQSRLEGHSRHGNGKRKWQDTVRSIASSSIFPLGQGEQQWDWEEPRLKSSMGFTVNGYNFTEDLLRLAGNAVVEQQSELAFRTLVAKFT